MSAPLAEPKPAAPKPEVKAELKPKPEPAAAPKPTPAEPEKTAADSSRPVTRVCREVDRVWTGAGFSACAEQARLEQWRQNTPEHLKKTRFSELKLWPTEGLEHSLATFVAGCPQLAAIPAWQEVCKAATAVPAGGEQAFFESYFEPWKVLDAGREEGTFTGYFEPELSGSLTSNERYATPLHAPPDDLIRVDLALLYPELKNLRLRGRLEGRQLVPYHERSVITQGIKALENKVLVWVDDPVDAFYLEIQGSGRIRLAQGGVMRVGYADQNGHPFRGIARTLADRGWLKLADATPEGVRQWARQNPDKRDQVLALNPSYVFFRKLDVPAEEGPVGTLGVGLNAQWSMAVDQRFVPLGAPLVWKTTSGSRSQLKTVIAQDTGGAIRGPVRGDFYWGTGDGAGRQAAAMKDRGSYVLLLPK